MLGNIAATATAILPPKSASDSAAGTSTWKLVTNYEGAKLITQSVGTVTAGTIAGAIYTATDDSGAGSAAVTGATFTSVGTGTDESAQTIVVQCNACGPYIAYVPTIVTGPAVVGCTAVGTPKY
jgi:hypothetical protein